MRVVCLPLLLAGGLFVSPVFAATLGFSWDNDLFVGQDQNYTNGLRFSFVGDGHDHCETDAGFTCGVARLASPLPGVSVAHQRHAFTVSLQQIMITPDNIERETANYNDLPYVGYSNLELGLFSWDTDELYGYGVRAGVVGPDSGAEESQKFAHHVTGSSQPQGWNHQLGQDYIGGVFAMYVKRALRHTLDNGYQTELGYSATVDINNFDGNAEVGGFIRFGRNLPGNFLPDYAGIGTVGSLVGLFDDPGWGWEVFLGLSAQYNGYSYIESHSGPYAVEARNGSGSVITGFGVRTGEGFSFTMTFQNSSSPLRNSGPVNFGNMSFMWAI